MIISLLIIKIHVRIMEIVKSGAQPRMIINSEAIQENKDDFYFSLPVMHFPNPNVKTMSTVDIAKEQMRLSIWDPIISISMYYSFFFIYIKPNVPNKSLTVLLTKNITIDVFEVFLFLFYLMRHVIKGKRKLYTHLKLRLTCKKTARLHAKKIQPPPPPQQQQPKPQWSHL